MYFIVSFRKKSLSSINEFNINIFSTLYIGVPYYEDSAFLKRPMQPLAGAALVTQLDFREQYLVVRLFRCENLPAANFDTGTSDPIVKIKWDGMTETSSTQTATVR
jgi:centrosomal protein CEP76